MNSPVRKSCRRAWLAAGLLAIAAPAVAFETGALPVHGSVSVTGAYSDKYNLLGDTDGRADLAVTELTLNGSHAFRSGLRASAQLYAYEIAGYNDLALDFATLDYRFNPLIGMRAGRYKHAFGLYGDAQDVDMVRPFAFLPLDFYDKTLRPINAALDGVEVYGNLPLGGAGSIDYRLDAGWAPPLSMAGPFFQDLSSTSPIRYTASDRVENYTVWAFWNTPVEGLRVGATVVRLPGFTFSGQMHTASSLAQAANDSRLLPGMFPAGMWDLAVAGRPAGLSLDLTMSYFSAEYTRGDWVFAAEASRTDVEQTITMPVLGTSTSGSGSESYYAMATWQTTGRLQLGSYYGLAYANKDDRRGRKLVAVPGHTAWQKDFALAASYQLASWWLVKAEVHQLNGTKSVPGHLNGDAARWKANWNYLVLKTTVSF